MNSYKNILIALDLSEADESLLKYAAAWCDNYGADKLYIVNVQRNLALPEHLRKLVSGEADRPLDEKLKEDMENSIRKHFPHFHMYDYEFDVIEGNPRDQITHWIDVKHIDLLMTGRKPEEKGRGILPQQLLRNSKCSVMFIPEGTEFDNSRIAVPVKLGRQEDDHIKTAIDLVADEGTVIVQHFYSIPSSYNHMIATTGMLLDGMKESAESECQDAIDKYKDDCTKKGCKVETVIESIVEYNLSDAIDKFSRDTQSKMIVMQSGVKSKLQAFLIGSETEAMVKRNRDFPLLIIK